MSEIAQALDRLLADVCPPAVVRAVERDGDGARAGAGDRAGDRAADRDGAARSLWRALEQSGFLDAMVPLERGGAGLALAEAFDLFVLQGRHAVPVPMAMTIAARGVGLPDPEAVPRELAAVVTAAQLAGALERVLELTVAFANQRVQFGRPIGKFQAIQHQLAVMAEQVAAARMAARLGCELEPLAFAGPSIPQGERVASPDRLRAAVAKARASEAAGIVAPLAHAIHGAIGITAELDLQLYTRRLHAWRAEHGSELHWQRVLGEAVLAADTPLVLDFVREKLLPQ